MDPTSRQSVAATARQAVVLAAAALFAAWALVPVLRERDWAESDWVASDMDAIVAELRPRLRPGERIQVLVPPMEPGEELEYWYSAQYALAPALVEPIRFRECLQPDPAPACRIARGTRVALLRPDAGAIAIVARRLGLDPVARVGAVVLLAKAAP